MSALAGQPAAGSVRARTANARARARRDLLMRGLLGACLVLALVPLALIILIVLERGLATINLEFLTSTQPISYRREGGGFLHGLVGTSLMVGIAILISVPLGICASLFLVEYRTSRLARPVRFFTDVMTGVPSIFVGLFVYAALVREAGLGFGTFVGGIAISILMLPIVVRTSEEILKLVPADLRAASTALGARRWQTTLFVVLPAAAPGLLTGVMLAVARGAGETAPLILTAFGTPYLVTALFGEAQTALPLLIFDQARQPFEAAQARAWAGALELVAVVLLLTIAARLIGRRSAYRGAG
ncbi:MAG TPA: phosphate ABC transporter permease PstA [Candidatus Limnocylindria bacterium]|nr:phosphate ABC transporter permease PstA [Candidatus Limnocylindria bacterium]